MKTIRFGEWFLFFKKNEKGSRVFLNLAVILYIR